MSGDTTIRLTEDGPVRYRGGDIMCERGETVTTNAGHADYLVKNTGYFEKVVETCHVEKSDGEICGRELPCAWHSDTEDDE